MQPAPLHSGGGGRNGKRREPVDPAEVEREVAALAVLSDDEIRTKFAATRQIRKLNRNFAGACCGCRAPLLADHRGWYKNHTRVLIIDGTNAMWNGLGNNMNRW